MEARGHPSLQGTGDPVFDSSSRLGAWVGMFGVRMVEVLSVIPVRWLGVSSYFGRTCVTSFDYGEVEGFEVRSSEVVSERVYRPVS